MDRYRIEPEYGDTVYLEEEPLKATSEFEVLIHPGAQGTPGARGGRDAEDTGF